MILDEDIHDGWEEWVLSLAPDCDDKMVDVKPEDIRRVLGISGAGPERSASERRDCFAALDREIMSSLAAVVGNLSTKNDTWSRRRFDEWRLQNGMPTSTPIECMELSELANLLPCFFLQVVKHNGDYYPLESHLGFYRGFTRILRKVQEARICETRVIEPPFTMKAHPVLNGTGIAILEAMRRCVLAGANKQRKRASTTSWANEQSMLSDKDHLASHPYGCFKRWAYYCISRFMIRSGKELYNLMDFDFREGKDDTGDFVIFGERLLSCHQVSPTNASPTITAPAPTVTSKSSRSTMKRCKTEQIQVSVKCHQQDVILTYKQFMKHQPVKVADEVGKPRHLFLQPIGNPVTNAWFAKSHVSERVLISLYKTMAGTAGITLKEPYHAGSLPNISKTNTLSLPSVLGNVSDQKEQVLKSMLDLNGLGGNVVDHKSQVPKIRHDTNMDLPLGGLQKIVEKTPEINGIKRCFQEAFGKAGNKHDSSIQPVSVELIASPVSGDFQLPVECQSSPDEKQAQMPCNTTPVQSLQALLLSARSQLKELESVMFEKMSLTGFSNTTSGQSMHDLVQVAKSHLKMLDSTLSSISSVL